MVFCFDIFQISKTALIIGASKKARMNSTLDVKTLVPMEIHVITQRYVMALLKEVDQQNILITISYNGVSNSSFLLPEDTQLTETICQ